MSERRAVERLSRVGTRLVRRVATCSDDGVVMVWNLLEGSVLARLQHAKETHKVPPCPGREGIYVADERVA